MPYKSIASLALAALVALGLHQPAQADPLLITGSSTVAHDLMMPRTAEIQARAGVQFDVESTGSGYGIKALFNNTADMAMISAPLREVVLNLNERDPGSIDGRELTAYEVGGAQVAFITHPSNPVRSITAQQLYDILNGKITNWSELGGLQMQIQVFVEPPGGGVRGAVEHRLAEWGDHLATEQYVQSAQMVKAAVSQVLGGFGVAAAVHADNSVAVLSTNDVVKQPYYIVTRGQASGQMMAVIEAARAVTGWRPASSGS